MIEGVEEKKGSVHTHVRCGDVAQTVAVSYSQNLWINVGGIVAGTGVSRDAFKPQHPKTQFLVIKGNVDTFKNQKIHFDFSARKDDDDNYNGYGIRSFDVTRKEDIVSPDNEQAAFIAGLKDCLDGTMLKGTIEFYKGAFVLHIFDNVHKVCKWIRPVVRYRDYEMSTRLVGNGIP